MRSELRVILVTVLLGGLWAVGTRVPDALARVDVFRITEVDVRGARYLDEDEVRSLLAIGPSTNLWTDTAPWKERLLSHRLIREVEVARRLPGTLVVDVIERQPVALVATPLLEAVDQEGRRLPIDPSRARMDLPVVASAVPAHDAAWVPLETRRLVAEVSRLTAADAHFVDQVSEVGWYDASTIFARWSEPQATLLLHHGASIRRLREGLAALEHAVESDGSGALVIDLRYADQVVVRRAGRDL